MVTMRFDGAATQAHRHAAHKPTIVLDFDVSTNAPEGIANTLQAVRLLDAQLVGTTHTGATVRHAAGEGKNWQFVDEARDLLGTNTRRRELCMGNFQVRYRLTRLGRAAIKQRDTCAHPLEHVKHARPRSAAAVTSP